MLVNGVPPSVVTPDKVPVNDGPDVMGVMVRPEEDEGVVSGMTVVPPTLDVVPAANVLEPIALLGGCPVKEVTIVDPIIVVVPAPPPLVALFIRLDNVVAGAPVAVVL